MLAGGRALDDSWRRLFSIVVLSNFSRRASVAGQISGLLFCEGHPEGFSSSLAGTFTGLYAFRNHVDTGFWGGGCGFGDLSYF